MNQQPPWMDKVELLSLFPSHVWTFNLTTGARRQVNGEILPLLERLRPGPEARLPGQGWQSQQDLHQQRELAVLVGYIDDGIRGVLRYLKVGYEAVEITGCWANVNYPGVAHRSHSHPNNFLSGIYYLQTPAGADTVNFHDPRVQTAVIRPPVTTLNAANTDQVVVKVSSGTLLLFPAWLQHSVDANSSDSERISISFNMMFAAFTEHLSRPLW